MPDRPQAKTALDCGTFSAGIAVRLIVRTMSSTRQLRERSFTGGDRVGEAPRERVEEEQALEARAVRDVAAGARRHFERPQALGGASPTLSPMVPRRRFSWRAFTKPVRRISSSTPRWAGKFFSDSGM